MNKPLFFFITIFVTILSSSFSFNTMAADKGLLGTLIPEQKNCSYVGNNLYEPFSNISNSFPGMKNLITKGKGGTNCIKVAGGTEKLLKNLFSIAISIIIILTVINISVSGIQFMTQEAVGKKGEAKKRLQNSFIALGLGLLSYTILYTVNKQLVNFNFDPSSIDKDRSIDKGIVSANKDAGTFSTYVGAIEALVTGVSVPYKIGPISPTGYINMQTGAPCTPVSGVPDSLNPCVKQNATPAVINTTYGTVSKDGEKINKEALNMLGQTTCKVDFTNGGKLACAYVVNSIINDALGKPLRGESNETDTFGRSTIEMKGDLDSSNSFYFVGTNVGTLLPGDVVISPTVGSNTGHVGIYTDTGKIISNSSSKTAVDDNFTPTSWNSYYGDKKNLGTYIYRPKN